MSQIVGLVVLPNDGRPGNSRTRTDGILSSRLVPGSWQSPRRALRGPRTTANTAEEFVRRQQERDRINRSIADISERFVRRQHERNRINPDIAGVSEGFARIPRVRNCVNPDKADSCGRTPLAFAALNGHEGIVRMLLKRGSVNPNTADSCGRTPLSLAAENGHEGIVRMLLEQNYLNADIAEAIEELWGGGGVSGTASIPTHPTPNMAEHRSRWLPRMGMKGW